MISMTQRGHSPGRFAEDPRHKTLCVNVSDLRNQRGMTGDELGQKLDTGKERISQIESGKESPRLETILRLADALGVHPALLLLKNPQDSVVIDGSIMHKWPGS